MGTGSFGASGLGKLGSAPAGSAGAGLGARESRLMILLICGGRAPAADRADVVTGHYATARSKPTLQIKLLNFLSNVFGNQCMLHCSNMLHFSNMSARYYYSPMFCFGALDGHACRLRGVY